MRAFVPARVGLVLLMVFLFGCKEGTIGPDLLGGIEGVVLDYETSAPLAGTSITTSPPTDAIVTDEQGQFSMEGLEVGNYTIQAKKPGYASNSVTVSVRENRTTEATIFLEVDNDEDEEPTPDMSAEITSWWNSSSNDSSFVNVEYRVQNTGTADIDTYEVYFRIEAEEQTFYHEENGTELRAGQSNLQQFIKYIPSDGAETVVVEDFWAE